MSVMVHPRIDLSVKGCRVGCAVALISGEVLTVKKFMTILLFVLVLPLVCRGQERAGLEGWLRQAESFLDRTESYTATFHKLERVKGLLKTKETVYLKFKKPFKVYMKWIENPGKGREILYEDGWNDNRILLREPRIMGGFTMNLRPQGPIAMNGSRHPITEAGLHHLVTLLGIHLRRVSVRARSN